MSKEYLFFISNVVSNLPIDPNDERSKILFKIYQWQNRVKFGNSEGRNTHGLRQPELQIAMIAEKSKLLRKLVNDYYSLGIRSGKEMADQEDDPIIGHILENSQYRTIIPQARCSSIVYKDNYDKWFDNILYKFWSAMNDKNKEIVAMAFI